jgi:hypothetical protein
MKSRAARPIRMEGLLVRGITEWRSRSDRLEFRAGRGDYTRAVRGAVSPWARSHDPLLEDLEERVGMRLTVDIPGPQDERFAEPGPLRHRAAQGRGSA